MRVKIDTKRTLLLTWFYFLWFAPLFDFPGAISPPHVHPSVRGTPSALTVVHMCLAGSQSVSACWAGLRVPGSSGGHEPCGRRRADNSHARTLARAHAQAHPHRERKPLLVWAGPKLRKKLRRVTTPSVNQDVGFKPLPPPALC